MRSPLLKSALLATVALALVVPALTIAEATVVSPAERSLAEDARAAGAIGLELDPAYADTVNTGANALDIAKAIAKDPATVIEATFSAYPPHGTPTAVSTTKLGTFPSAGDSFAILTTGDAAFAPLVNNNPGTSATNGGGAVRGTSDRDVVILKIYLRSLPGHFDNCVSVDFRFLTEEFPEWVGSRRNDAFVAETLGNTWTTMNLPPSYSLVVAPTNFAFDDVFDLVSLNTLGQAGFSEDAAANTTYDGATPHYRAYGPLAVVAIWGGLPVYEIFFSIFDQGDDIYDSAVFLDNLDIFYSPACAVGPATKVGK